MDKVFKKVHEDGSETVIKSVSPAFRDGKGVYCERDDTVTSVFISSSYGCRYRCAYCHLTENGTKFKDLSRSQIVNNVLEALSECDFYQEQPVKLCFMGMGDACVDGAKTLGVIENLMGAINVSEVDISTVNPNNNTCWFSDLQVPVRLFYSLPTNVSFNKNLIVSCGTEKPSDIQYELRTWSTTHGDLFIHYTPVLGLNDSQLDALSVAKYAKKVGAKQVRMLEFNPHDDSPYERPSIEQMVKLKKVMERNGVSVKWQVSKGYGENAACGMFNK